MSRFVSASLLSVAILMVASFVHLASILILPHVAPDDAFSRLLRTTGPNTVMALPPPGSGQTMLPFRDPALASAVCRYDLRGGHLRVGVVVGEAAFLSVSLHSSTGVAFYALTDRAASDGRIELVVMTPAQREAAEAADNDDTPVKEVRVSAADPQGFVEFDVLPRVGASGVEQPMLRSATCQLERDR